MSGFGFTGDGFGNEEGKGMPDLGALFTQLGKMFSGEPGALPESTIRDIARGQLGNDRYIGHIDLAEVTEALNLADLWINDTTAFPSALRTPQAWSKADWVESTMSGWMNLVAPMSKSLTDGLTKSLTESQVEGIDLSAMTQGPLAGVFQQMTGMLLAQQVGGTVAAVAKLTTGSADTSLPLAADGVAALIPTNVNEWGEGLGIDMRDVRLFLALREIAGTRLLAEVPWLRGRLTDAVTAYGSGIQIDVQAISDQAMDVMNALQEGADPRSLFTPATTPAQELALAQLETLLALFEGWVNHVVHLAIAERLPSHVALEESSRRKRVSQNPTTTVFQSLVGLEVSPRLSREATHFWNVALELKGLEGRDELWSHPDLLPAAVEMQDPAAFLSSTSAPDDLSGLDPA